MTPQNKGGRPVGLVLPYRELTPKRCTNDGTTMQITITVDDEAFAEIDRLARQLNCRVGRMASTLVNIGISEFKQGEGA